MEKDIVIRLRRLANAREINHPEHNPAVTNLLREAAQTIEDLRFAAKNLMDDLVEVENND